MTAANAKTSRLGTPACIIADSEPGEMVRAPWGACLCGDTTRCSKVHRRTEPRTCTPPDRETDHFALYEVRLHTL